MHLVSSTTDGNAQFPTTDQFSRKNAAVVGLPLVVQSVEEALVVPELRGGVHLAAGCLHGLLQGVDKGAHSAGDCSQGADQLFVMHTHAHTAAHSHREANAF